MAATTQLSEKASRYIDQLTKVRCEGRWDEVPELARKVEKHAPWKNCLATAAREEARFERELVTGSRAEAASKPHGIREAVELVLLAIKESKATVEEVFQARTCIQWLHWVDGEWDSAILCIAPDAVTNIETEQEGELSEWTDVCIAKSAFIRGASLEAKGKTQEAVGIYKEVVARMLTTDHPARNTTQYKFWAERLLNRSSRLLASAVSRGDASQDGITDALESFRAWSRLGGTNHSRSGLTHGGASLEDNLPRRQTWLLYHELLSQLIRRVSDSRRAHGNAYAGDIAIPSKLALLTETQQVESTYDALLMREVSFPQADQYNTEVDQWADLTMTNWAHFVGPSWKPEDIPLGGKRGLSKRQLEILYHGATKTFHSMTILRHLSSVHASLGEFNLAVRALNSYVTIGTKAKARIQKSGESEPGVDSDDTFVTAIATGIEMLCVFGERAENDRAQELATLLRHWLHEDGSPRSPASPKSPQQSDQEKLAHENVHVAVHSRTASLAHRAIGISFARWSFLTYEPAKRGDLQQSALEYLRKSLRGSPGNETNLEALYALSLTCAEARETQGAIAAVKEALIQSVEHENDVQTLLAAAPARPSRPSTLVTRCWHLLTLLLSSRQDYDSAAASCDEALEQLRKQMNFSHTPASMDIAEKRSTISLRVSRIALKELLEGPDAAVNESTALLTLYGDLFKPKPKETKPEQRLEAPTAVPGRTLSLRGTFGRNRESKIGANAEASKSQRRLSDSSVQNHPSLAVPEGTTDQRPPTSRSHRSLSRSNSKRLQKRSSKRSINRPASGVKQQPTTDGGVTKLDIDQINQSAVTAAPPHLSPVSTGNNLQNEIGLAKSGDGISPDGTAATIPEIDQPPPELVQCRAIHYTEAQESRRAVEILIDIWVYIAGLYRRAQLYSDAASACIEALKQVRTLESAVAAHKSSAEEFAKPGWGGAKSIEELRADTLAEQGYLKLAISGPREAQQEFESALTHFPDHVAATVGLCNILLDVYEDKLPPEDLTSSEVAITEELTDRLASKPLLATVPGLDSVTPAQRQNGGPPSGESEKGTTNPTANKVATSATSLDRLAARDRAYNLLAALSKLGTGWDQSEVWFALARAYELSGQVEKAQEALWWVVELEKKRPIRHWGCLGQGYSLWF